MEYVDGQLVSVRDRIADAKANENESRTQVLQDIFKRKKEEAAASPTTTGKNSQFKVVSNKRDSIISTGHPSGWINRTADREEKVGQGHEWRSEAFHIV